MNLYDLETNKFSKLHTVLNDVFETNFNFNMPKAKLEQVAVATDQKIKKLKESGMDVSSRDMQKLLLIAQGLKTVMAEQDDVEEEVIAESDLDQAEVLLAARQLCDDLQKMAEDLASMQVEDLMSIHSAMKEEVGTAEADAFNASAEAAISGALEAVKSAKEGVDNALLTAQGQAPAAPTDMDMDMEPAMDPEAPAEDPMGDEMPDMGDDIEGADAGAEGREMKESAETVYLNALKTIKEAQVEGKVNKAVLKKAFESLKKFKVSEKSQQGATMGGGSQHAFDNKSPKQAPSAPKPKAPAKKAGPKKGATMGGGTTSAAFK